MMPTFAQYSPEPPEGGAGPPSTSTATAPPLTNNIVAIPIKPTRKQVSRACDWCRARRIKCDNGRPCLACRQRGADCTHKGTHEPRTLPQAMKEIDKLKLRVKELEAELSIVKLREPTHSAPVLTPTDSASNSATPPGVRDVANKVPTPRQDASPLGTNQLPPPVAFSALSKPQWEGIHVATAHTDQASYYGPASASYFISRLVAYIGKSLQQPCLDRSIQPRGVSRDAAINSGAESGDLDGGAGQVGGQPGAPGASMNRTQEEYFLSLFWESYHCLMPIIDESDFRRHYSSLWEPARTYRKPSPLVDIVLAMCLQYGYTFMLRDEEATSPEREQAYEDATIAGRWYYRRCLALLAADLESPCLTTVQCYLFSATYLCCASFQNMSHVTMAQALRTAHLLGLHLEPPADMPLADKELRKRIWLVLILMESKISVKLGRPHLIDTSSSTVSPPSDSLEVASLNGATLGSYGDVTWLTYILNLSRLVQVTHGVYDALYDKCGEVMKQKKLNSLYKDPQALEMAAGALASSLPAMRAWLDSVPAGLKTRRRDGGDPYSVDRSPLDIDPLAPTWLQRQRLSLELLYHTMVSNLCRPFIAFYSSSTTYTPIAERHATTCVNHAIAHTMLMHQIVTETDILSGWSEFFVWQWNAALTMVGFSLAYPIHPATPNARKALEKSLSIFDIFGVNFAVAASAASITRDLMTKAQILGNQLRNGTSSTPSTVDATASSVASGPAIAADGVGIGVGGGNAPSSIGGQDSLSWLDPSQQEDPTYFSEFMDWALSVDSFNSFEKFFDPSSGPAGPWAMGQGQGFN